MTIGERLRLFPVNIGSNTLPMINWVTINPKATKSTRKEKPNFKIPINIGNKVAIMEPKLGMKFNTKTNKAEKMTKSNLPANKMIPTINAVEKLTKVLIKR